MKNNSKTPLKEPARPVDHLHDDGPPKESFHDEVHGGGHGGTEMGWLVSYADMMTLLFGLFVILFSLATDNKKDVEQVMKAVAQEYFSSGSGLPDGTSETVSPLVTVPPPIEMPLTETPAEIPPSDTETPEKPQAATDQTNDLKTQLEALHAEYEAMSKEKKNTERKLAGLEKSKGDSASQVDELKAQLDKERAENEILKRDKDKNKSPTQSYMMVMMTWEKEKHDLDLSVINPNGKTFNFKKRVIKGEAGKFELDSRYGPGMEMWKSENFQPGKYFAHAFFYSGNGNAEGGSFRITVVTNLQTYNSPVIDLAKQGQETKVGFEVNADGQVEFKP